MAFGSSGFLTILKARADLLGFSPLSHRFFLPTPVLPTRDRYCQHHANTMPTPIILTPCIILTACWWKAHRLLVEGNVVVDFPEVVPGLQGVPPLIIVLVSPSKLGLVVTASPRVRPLGSWKRVLV